MKQLIKDKKFIMLALALLLIAAIGTSMYTLAYLVSDTGEIDNTFKTVEVPTQIEENIEKITDRLVLKQPRVHNLPKETSEGQNLDSTDAFIRARITVSPDITGAGASEIQLQYGVWNNGVFTPNGTVYFTEGREHNGWIYSDGYFYFKTDVAPDGYTNTLFDAVVIGDSVSENFDITIYQEAVSSKNFVGSDGTATLDNMKAAFDAVTK